MKEYDISTMEPDEIQSVVESYDPFDPTDISFDPSKREPPPEALSLEEFVDIQALNELRKMVPPEEISMEELFTKPYGMTKAEAFLEKSTKLAGKGIWKTLSILSWPFERIEAGISTPATSAMKAVAPLLDDFIANNVGMFTTKSEYKNMVRSGLSEHAKASLGEQLEPMLEQMAEEAVGLTAQKRRMTGALKESKSHLPELLPAFARGAKSFIPFTRNDPEKVKYFNDFWAAYYEGLTGEPAPEAYKQTVGISTSFLVTPQVTGKILKTARKGLSRIPLVQRIAARKIPDWEDAKLLRKANIYERNQRAVELGRKLADKDARKIAARMSRETGKNITPEAVKLRLGQVIKGSLTQQQALAERANPVIEELQKNFDELKKLGVLSEKTYLTKLTRKEIQSINTEKGKLLRQLKRLETAPHYVGTTEISARFPGRAAKIQDLKTRIEILDERLWTSRLIGGELYSPRMYTTKEAEAAARRFPVKGGPKVRAPYAKARKEIPVEVRREMGEILEPAYPVTKRLIQESMDIETAKLYQNVFEHGEWWDDVWRKGLSTKRLPDTKSYGALKGKFVTQKIYDDITELNRVRSDFESLYDSVVGSWKVIKVVLSPSTHFRNTLSNSILLDLSGTDQIAQTRLFGKALKEILSGSDEYKTAKRFFARTTMIEGEILDDMLKITQADKSSGLQKVINTWNKMFGKVTGPASKTYQQEEFIFKFMKFLEQREQGKSVLYSVKEANKWLFDYSDLSNFEKIVARRAMPFYTFPRKALPRVLEAAEKRPLTLAKYPLMAWTLEKYSLAKLDITEKDHEQMRKLLPDYMQRGSYLLLPWRDDNGDLQFFDWTYIVPWGELFDAQDRGLLGATITNPLFQLVADITRNKSGWSGREIWKETDTPKEKTFKEMLHVWQTAAPSLMYKGIYWDKLYEAATGKPSKMGTVRPLAPTIAHTIFGLRSQPIDLEKQRQFKLLDEQSKLEELEGKIADITIREANGNITKEEYDKLREQYLRQIEQITTRISEISSVPTGE